jgi:hypothetical protein
MVSGVDMTRLMSLVEGLVNSHKIYLIRKEMGFACDMRSGNSAQADLCPVLADDSDDVDIPRILIKVSYSRVERWCEIPLICRVGSRRAPTMAASNRA